MRALPHDVVQGLATKSAKIRALDAAGYSRTEISAFLEIRYQHVRNVLVKPSVKKAEAHVISASPSMPAPRGRWHLQRLIDAGFELIGDCRTVDESAFEYSAKAPTSGGVYAFAVDEWVAYVGLTRNGLRTRLGHYVYGHAGQRTSARVKGLILQALSKGQKVSVLVAQPPQLVWNGLPVDGAAGLETGLIGLLKPPWNQHGAT